MYFKHLKTISIVLISCIFLQVGCTNVYVTNKNVATKSQINTTDREQSKIEDVLSRKYLNEKNDKNELDEKYKFTDEEKYYQDLKDELLTDLKDMNEGISPTTLNLAYKFDLAVYQKIMHTKVVENPKIKNPTISNTDRIYSKAGEIFKSLVENNNAFIHNAYDGASKRLYKNIFLKCEDGDGNEIDAFASLKEIMAMANVFTYYHNPFSEQDFVNYCIDLFMKSCSYDENSSDIYFCDGCTNSDGSLYKDIEIDSHYLTPEMLLARYIATDSIVKFDLVNEKNSFKSIDLANNFDNINNNQLAGTLDRTFYTNDELQKVSDSKYFDYCEGHMDINIKIILREIDDEKSLFDVDEIGNNPKYFNSYWHGWDIYKKQEVMELVNKDWLELYGLNLSKISTRDILTQDEINHYLRRLPKNISEDRYKIIKTALESVGRIPYYWGGMAYSPGYENNNFFSIVQADRSGRTYRGLDCAGWVNWVIWTATGKQIHQEGTVRLQSFGKKIRRTVLQPGDLIVRPFVDSHVVMFLEWAEDGKAVVIHENATHCNVTVDTMECYYTYYRNIPF